MEEMPPLPREISTDRSKALVVAFGCAVFVGLGIFILLHNSTSNPADQFEGYIIGIGCCLFFGLCFIVAAISCLKNRLIFIIGQEGITFKKPPVTIKWDEIESTGIAAIGRQKFVTVFLTDKEHYYKRLSPVHRKLGQMSENLVGTPFSLPNSMTGIKAETMLEWVNFYLAKSRN